MGSGVGALVKNGGPHLGSVSHECLGTESQVETW
jgi:hypothetical protein